MYPHRRYVLSQIFTGGKGMVYGVHIGVSFFFFASWFVVRAAYACSCTPFAVYHSTYSTFSLCLRSQKLRRIRSGGVCMRVRSAYPKRTHFSHICTPQRSKIACRILSTYLRIIDLRDPSASFEMPNDMGAVSSYLPTCLIPLQECSLASL